MNTSSITPTTWHNLPALALEGEALRVVVVPQMGGKIVSLLDKRGGCEWLVGPIPGRPVRPVAYAAPFTEQEMAGWDEMFPTIVACAYPGPGPRHGAALPDHGEVWALPWVVTAAAAGELILAVEGRALPYRLTRVATLGQTKVKETRPGIEALAGLSHYPDKPANPTGRLRTASTPEDTLILRYTLENLGDEPLPYLWAAHPQFLAGADCQVILPPEVTQVVNTLPAVWGWGAPETCFAWPEAVAPAGRSARLDEIGSPALRQARKFFALSDARPAWAKLLRRDSGHWLRLEWDPADVPYLGLWVDEGAIHCEAIAALEPMTGWYDSLALAWAKEAVKIVPAGGTHTWTLVVRVGETDETRRMKDELYDHNLSSSSNIITGEAYETS